MIIYRVEDEEGIGPYRRCYLGRKGVVRLIHPDGYDYTRHIGLQGICFSCPDSKLQFCGFARLRHVYDWFNHGERITLRGLGFKLARYSVSKRFVDLHQEGQVLFFRNNATLIQRYEISVQRIPYGASKIGNKLLSVG